MDDAEFLGVVRSMIQHEDGLRDQRLGWLFALNGFLFAAVGFAWHDAGSKALVVVFAAVGACIGVSCAALLRANEVAIRRLADLARERSSAAPGALPPVIALRSGDLAAEPGRFTRSISHMYPWRVVPWCLVVAWAAIAVVGFAEG